MPNNLISLALSSIFCPLPGLSTRVPVAEMEAPVDNLRINSAYPGVDASRIIWKLEKVEPSLISIKENVF